MSKPPKLTEKELLEIVKAAIQSGNYRYTDHALIQMEKRSINDRQVVQSLTQGQRYKRKDSVNPGFRSWNYGFRLIDPDNLEKREVIIINVSEGLLIITVMYEKKIR